MQSTVLAIVNPSIRLSVCLSVTRWHCVKTTQAIIMLSSLEDSPTTLVSIFYNLKTSKIPNFKFLF